MDWKNVIQSIASQGWTQSQIAVAIGVKQSTIAGVVSGAHKDMRWRNGERLLDLYEKVTGSRPSEVDAAHQRTEAGHA